MFDVVRVLGPFLFYVSFCVLLVVYRESYWNAILFLYTGGCRRTCKPRVETLLFSDSGWEPMSCAAAMQAKRFSRSAGSNVTLILLDNDVDFASWSSRPAVAAGISVITLPSVPRDESEWVMPTYYDELLYLRLRATALRVRTMRDRFDGLLLLDSDTVLFRNIGARMARIGTDFVFQRELPCHTERARRCLNAGVWWVSTRSDETVRVLQHAVHLMEELLISDQDALQHALAASNASVTYLDPLLYPNGFVYNYDRRLRAARTHMVHLNWSPAGIVGKHPRLYDLGIVRRYAQCFIPYIHRILAAEYANVSAPDRRLRSGFQLPLLMPRGVTWRDLGNALGCADVEDRRCIMARVEPRALPSYLLYRSNATK